MTLSGVIITEKSYESSDGRVRKIRYFDKPWFQIASIVWLAASNVKWISHNFKILRKYNVNIICTLKNSFLKKRNIILIFPTISKRAPNLTNSLFLHLFQNSPESIQRQGNSKERVTTTRPPISFPREREEGNLPIREIASSWLDSAPYKCASDKGPGIEAYYVRYKRGGSGPAAGLGRWKDKKNGRPAPARNRRSCNYTVILLPRRGP